MFRAVGGLEASGDRAMVSDMSGAHASVSHLRVDGGRRCRATRYSNRPRARQTKVRKGTRAFAEGRLMQARKLLLVPPDKAGAALSLIALSRCHKLRLPLLAHVRRHSPPVLHLQVQSTKYHLPVNNQTPSVLQSSLVHRQICLCLGFSSTLVLLPPPLTGILSAPRPNAVSQPTLYHHPETSMLPPQS
jgi:hypothetical protein